MAMPPAVDPAEITLGEPCPVCGRPVEGRIEDLDPRGGSTTWRFDHYVGERTHCTVGPAGSTTTKL